MSRSVPLLHRFPDPETSNDPRVRDLVRQLSVLDYAPAPRPEFRRELRAQLVAIAGRVVAEGDGVAEVAPATLDPTEAARAASTATVTTLDPAARDRRTVGRRVARPLGLAAACCAVLALGLGGAVWKSRDALPGDSLYGLKRASENLQLSLASGDTDKGHDYLKLASTRVQEAKDLIGQDSALASGSGVQAGGLSPATVSLIRSTLRSANADVTSGSSLLGTEAVTSHSASPLSIMTGWAPGQLTQLEQLATAIGTGPARTSTLQSWTLVHSALLRARHLQRQVGAHCVAEGTDPLGPRSCARVAPAGTPRHTTKHGSTPASRHHVLTATPRRSHRPETTTSDGAERHHSTHPSGTDSSGPARKRPSTAPTTLPTTLPSLLPSSLPSLPVSINSCGVSVQAGPIGVHLGSCPSGS